MASTHTQDLKPCPFCGGLAFIGGAKRGKSCYCMDCRVGWSLVKRMSREEAIDAWNRRVSAPAVPDDVAEPWRVMLRQAEDDLRKAHSSIEAQAAELARLRSEAETTSAALSQAWVREAAAIAQRDAVRDACNQARLAFAGYVSQQSAVDKLDAALTHPTGGSKD